ncbi:MAG: hypothetical protein U0800_06340 [Isosphaeraceae bacterium]
MANPGRSGGPRAAANALQAMRDATRNRKRSSFRAADDVPAHVSRRRRRWRSGFAIFFGLLLMPICYETTALSVARWRSMTGPSATVHTPVLNALDSGYKQVTRMGSRAVSSRFNNVPWRPSWVLAFGAVWCLLGWMFFRRL